MKILMLCADWGIPLGGDGGSSVHFREMAAAFVALGHDVKIVVANDTGNTLPINIPFEHVPIRIYWPCILQKKERLRVWRNSIKVFSKKPIGPVVKAVNPICRIPDAEIDETFCRTHIPFKIRFAYQTVPCLVDHAEELLFYCFRFGARVSRFINEWHPDFIYERYALGQTGGVRAARKAKVPYYLEINAPLVNERTIHSNLGRVWHALGLRDEKLLWTKADHVFCVSDELRLEVVAVGAKAERVVTTPNGVNCRIFSPQRATGKLRRVAPAGSILIGWLGSLSKGRGVEEFIKMLPPVIKQIPSAHAIVIGGGPLMNNCCALASELGLDGRISFTGGVAHDQVPELLADLDIAVASYPADRLFYFSPMKIFEYMASALPVVAGAMGQMKTLIVDGKTGLLVPPADLEAWINALVKLCNDEQLRSDIGSRAREMVASRYSWRRNAEVVCAEAALLMNGRKE